jgi:hypothetical protein
MEETRSHIINLYMMALSDGDFAPQEMELILTIAEERGISKEEFEKIISNPLGVKFYVPNSFMDRIKLLYDFVRIIKADDVIEQEEKEMFLKFCNKFKFDEESSNELFDWLVELSDKKMSMEDVENEINKLVNS